MPRRMTDVSDGLTGTLFSNAVTDIKAGDATTAWLVTDHCRRSSENLKSSR